MELTSRKLRTTGRLSKEVGNLGTVARRFCVCRCNRAQTMADRLRNCVWGEVGPLLELRRLASSSAERALCGAGPVVSVAGAEASCASLRNRPLSRWRQRWLPGAATSGDGGAKRLLGGKPIIVRASESCWKNVVSFKLENRIATKGAYCASVCTVCRPFQAERFQL